MSLSGSRKIQLIRATYLQVTKAARTKVWSVKDCNFKSRACGGVALTAPVTSAIAVAATQIQPECQVLKCLVPFAMTYVLQTSGLCLRHIQLSSRVMIEVHTRNRIYR